MQRVYLGYMCFSFALAAALACIGSLPGMKEAAVCSIFPLIAAAWCFVRSRGRSYGWLMLGCMVFVVLPLMKNLWPGSSESAVPASAIGRAAYAAGDRVLRVTAWICEKIRYKPRDPPHPPSS